MKTSTSLLILILPFTSFARDGFENPPTLSARSILKREFVSGRGFAVRNSVPTRAGRNEYSIDTEGDRFEADGNDMLIRRIQEVEAISKLREISRTAEYKKALATAVGSPLHATVGLVGHPVDSVTGVPKGLWKYVNRTGEDIKERAQGRKRGQYESSDAAQLIGFEETKREVAVKLGVDPYSSNAVLQRELDRVAWAAYAGQATFTLATAPVGGGAGIALTAAGMSDACDCALRDQSPADLRLASLARLLAMGCDRADADAFLNNVAFTPSVQSELVLHLASLDGVANRAAFVRLASGQTNSEADALFFAQTSRLLAQLHHGAHPLARLDTLDRSPVAIGKDGRVILALDWDYTAWTPKVADLVTELKAAKLERKPPTGYLMVVSGDASPLFQQKLKAAGVTLIARAASGPLK